MRIVLCATLLLCIGCQSDLPRDVARAYRDLPDRIDFNTDVQPILSDRCYACHGPDANAREADLRLDTEAGALAILPETGHRAVVPDSIDQSVLVTRILHPDLEEQMPPPDANLPLSAAEKAVLIKWIEQGAEWQPHWAFIAPVRPALPQTRNTSWGHNEIDAFVLARLEQKKLRPARAAGKEALLRRVSFDLTGLPPTLEDLDAFLNDTAPDAYEHVVDRLLDAPAYGERWAWEWLDVARYADTNGFQADPTRTMWPWRDWVVQAFNDNMPFDRFTVEQLAGDLLPDATQRQVLATGFNRNHMYNGEGGRVPEETRVENVFDRVETMGTAWLGLTLNCSRCHDHKYDPITQHEYFQFYDYFNQTSEDGGLYGNGQVPPILDLAAPGAREAAKAAADVFNAHARDVTEAEKHLFPRAEGLLPGDSPRAAPLHNRQTLQARAKSRNRASLTFLADEMEEAEPAYATQLRELAAAKAALDHAREQDVRVMIMDHLEEPRKTFVLDRGTYDKPTTLKATADVPAFLPPLPDQAPANRFALAQWIVAPNNPLTARVTVNRYWQAFFGVGLVKTTEDFGLQGEQPSHPDLLDWLAVAFMESGWDLKALHKRIVMSATYRQSAVITPALLEVDPDNRWLARGPRHRLPSWMIRDLALASSGLLVDTLGGPSVKPYQPDGIWNEATFGIIQYDQDQGDKLYRRTLYTFWRRIVGPTMLFDNAPRQVCSVKPPLTNSPMHALTTLNDIAYVEAARVMAARVMQMEADETERIRTAFRIVTSRWPTAEEQSILTERLEKLRQQYGASPNEALKIIAVGESPSNPNLDPVEHAAFTGLCSLLLNLDETITKQ